MVSIYEKFCDARNKLPKEICWEREEKMSILVQLANKAFTNKEYPDELPKKFKIKTSGSSSEETLKEFLYELEIKKIQTIQCISNDYFKGKTFEVKLF